MKDHRILGVGLLVVAVLLVANPLYIFQHPDEINEVKIGNTYDRTPAANYTYENLSDPGQKYVRKAIESPTNATQFRGDEKRPPEFTFDPPENGSGIVAGEVYRVEYNGTNYTVETFAPPRVVNTETRRSEALIAYGVVLGLVGGMFLWRRQPRSMGIGLGALGALFLFLNLGYRYAGDALGWVTLLGSSIFVVLALLGAIVSAGYLFYRSMRQRRQAQFA